MPDYHRDIWMKRYEIDQEFQVKQGIVRKPGRYYGKPVYMVYYVPRAHGSIPERDGNDVIFTITPDEHELFPELEGKTKVIVTITVNQPGLEPVMGYSIRVE